MTAPSNPNPLNLGEPVDINSPEGKELAPKLVKQWNQQHNVDNLFTYHAPNEQQLVQLQAVRSKAKELAHVILDNTPAGPDQSAAIRKLRECVMTANAAICIPEVPVSVAVMNAVVPDK
jgi:hypothetical protein